MLAEWDDWLPPQFPRVVVDLINLWLSRYLQAVATL